MVRIAGVELPKEKRIDIALIKIYGVGRNNVVQILEKAEVNPSTRTKNLADKEIRKLEKVIEGYRTEGDLRRETQENIKRLKRIRCYRGLRHLRNLPVRGQRTRSNARTKRGKRVTIGAMRKNVRSRMERPKSFKQKEEVTEKS